MGTYTDRTIITNTSSFSNVVREEHEIEYELITRNRIENTVENELDITSNSKIRNETEIVNRIKTDEDIEQETEVQHNFDNHEKTVTQERDTSGGVTIG
jgi:hypothetical protein